MRRAAWVALGAILLAAARSLAAAQPPDSSAAQPPIQGDLVAPLPPVAAAPDGERRPRLDGAEPPALGGLEEAVVEQLRAAEGALLAGLARPTVAAGELAAAWGELGMVYQAYGFPAAAAAAYRAALAAEPDPAAPRALRWTYYLGLLAQQGDEAEVALQRFDAVLAALPDYPAAHLHRGEVLAGLGRLDAAQASLERALALAPGDAATLAGLGQLALSRHDYAAARTYLEAALAKAPYADRYHYPLGLALRGLGELEAAKQHLAQRGEVGVRADDPWLAEVEALRSGERIHVLRGRVAFRAGRLNDAVSEFEAALAANPRSVPALINLSAALSGLGQAGAARERLEQALQLAPENRTARFNLGLLRQQAGDLDGAAELLVAVARESPGDAVAADRAGDVLMLQGQPAAAFTWYRAAIAADAHDESARMGELAALFGLGQYARARDRLELAVVELPGSTLLKLAFARLLAAGPRRELRDGERALRLAREVFAAQADVDGAETLAMALAETGDCAAAALWQEKVLQALERAGVAERLAGARAGLERYRQGAPCGAPEGVPAGTAPP